MIFEFKITLKDVGVPVWRKIQIDSTATFRNLHKVIQLAFEWENMHLHSFFVKKSNGSQINNIEIGPENTEDEFQSPFETHNEDDMILADWFKEVKDKVIYLYDYGDNWDHDVVLMKKSSPKQADTYPRCTGARNNAPEEDSRGEVIMGEVNLKNENTQKLIDAINESLLDTDENVIDLDELDDWFNEEAQDDPWEDVLLKAKEFSKLKPWEFMDDSKIFAVVDPVMEELLFCSVLGSAGEVYGLAVYQGKQGYDVLIDVLNGALPDFDFILKQRSLLMRFEDRLDLEKEDYDFVKTYDVSFRGKKAWPEFRSLKPGYVPWFMDDDEGWTMLEVLEQAIELCTQVKNGLELPDIYEEEKVLARLPDSDNNEIISLKEYSEQKNVVLEVPELDLKRAQKLTKQVPVTIEFSIAHLDMPVKDDSADRPVYPALVVAVENEQGVAFFQDLLYDSTDIGLLQNQLIRMLHLTEGIPEKVMMGKKTAAIMEPLTTKLDVNVEVHESLPHVQEIISGIEESV